MLKTSSLKKGANCGEAAGQSVMHLHLHLTPRYRGDMENPKEEYVVLFPQNKNMNLTSFDPKDPEIKERVVQINPLAFFFLSYMPIVPGHLLICPLRVVASSEELTNKEWQAILELKHQACLALKKAFYTTSFNFAWNQGEHAGQSIPHFHLHVLPRKPGDNGILN